MAPSILWNWLSVLARDPCPYKRFSVLDISESAKLPPATRQHLIELILYSRISKELLEEAGKLGGDVAKRRLIDAALPKNTKVKRGDFGEVVSGALLSEFLGYRIPIQKLRYAINPDQSQQGTDIIAIRLSETKEISEVCFVESKLRTSRDTGAGVAGYDQLRTDYARVIPKMIFFTLNRLRETKDTIFPLFLKYAFDRANTVTLEKFHLGLFYEPDTWSETVLANLEDAVPDNKEYPGLSVHVASIPNLRGLTQQLFKESGFGDVLDDD